MKTINITGKKNINKLINDKNMEKVSKRRNISYEEPSHTEQIKLINKYYMNQQDNMETNIIREIKSKLNGYKNQDIKKHIYQEDKLIKIDQII